MAVSGIIRLTALVNEREDSAENTDGPVRHRFDDRDRSEYRFEDGVNAGQADLVWSDRRQVSASATDAIDLTDLTDRFGNAISFAEVTAILVYNRSSTAADILEIGPDTTDGWTAPWDSGSRAKINPGGRYYRDNDGGWLVQAASKVLDIVETGGASAVDYDIIIVGRSA